MPQIKIVVARQEVRGRLNDTVTAGKVWDILPITTTINLWGEEIYFSIPLAAPPEKAVETVAAGDIAYWSEGQAMCLFLGKTPISRGTEIRAASPVNIIGRIEATKELLKQVKDGDEIVVRR
ncbi:MAG: hypothetical protein HY670_03170 [Chloroflexi bacterium]|nr:hypothetical protein [Chloroflexota bacterium]